MYQAAAPIWNELAATQPLQTEMAKRLFPLPQEQLSAALEAEHAVLAEELGDPVVALVYQTVAPLLWERKAISAFVAKHGPNPALPEVLSIEEAVQIGSMEHLLTVSEQKTLRERLRTAPA